VTYVTAGGDAFVGAGAASPSAGGNAYNRSDMANAIAQMDPGAFHRQHREAVLACLARTVDSGWYILGSEVSRFEEEFRTHFGYAHALGVANGTDALVLALRALGIGPGRRVATVSHTAVATVAAIELAGAEPVLLDIDPVTYTLAPDALERALADIPGIAAVIPVHLYGHPADLPALQATARRHGIAVIEDCSQAHGTALDGRVVGLDSDAATFSFYPTKNLGALGDGGMVVARDAAVAERIKSLREYGWRRRYVSDERGMNSRLDELQAAVLRYRLAFLDAGNQRRAAIAAAYDSGLTGTSVGIPQRAAAATHTHHQYVVRHPHRERLREHLTRAGVGTNVHYPVPVHLQPAYLGRLPLDPAGLAHTELAASQILSLPMYPELDAASVAAVIDVVRRFEQ
jgi:dTDP-4-amino-4,6-dideoxygalactose transaminase